MLAAEACEAHEGLFEVERLPRRLRSDLPSALPKDVLEARGIEQLQPPRFELVGSRLPEPLARPAWQKPEAPFEPLLEPDALAFASPFLPSFLATLRFPLAGPPFDRFREYGVDLLQVFEFR